jgi:hypothetical protein
MGEFHMDESKSSSTRQEVSTFIGASETLLSPVLLGEPLSMLERDVIEFYALALYESLHQGGDTPPKIPYKLSCP